jgi:hypothetical protein
MWNFCYMAWRILRIPLAILILLLGLLDALGDCATIAPDWPQVVGFGCAIDRQGAYHRLTVWTDYDTTPKSKHDWERVYAMREGRMRCLRDCDEWLKLAEKQTKRTEPRLKTVSKHQRVTSPQN